jgi:hypothetical protein
MTQPPNLKPDIGPLRVQIWGPEGLIDVVPIRIIDEVPDDLIYRAKTLIQVRSLAFVYGGKVYPHKLNPPVIVPKGSTMHLALKHLQLKDKFGRNVLGKRA